MFREKLVRKLKILTDREKQRLILLKIVNFIVLKSIYAVGLLKRTLVKTIKAFLPSRMVRQLKGFSLNYSGEQKTRRYLKSNLSLEDCFEELKKRNVSYVILRWFENMPVIKAGEDIDILVSDSDIDKISDLFSSYASTIAFDIYSVSGLVGSDYRGMSYYPPPLAQQILESRTWSKDIYAVPDSEHHLLSLAYHAVYHKGQNSGLDHHEYESFYGADHDYYAEIKKIASKLDFSFAENEYIKIHEFLKERNWSPKLDVLRRLSIKDKWLFDLLPAIPERLDSSDGELMVFVVRDWAIENQKTYLILQELDKINLDILEVVQLSESEKGIATRELRGGQWGQGPYPVSGGKPAQFIICYDYHPEKPLAPEIVTHPFVRNRHVFVKKIIRNRINDESFWWAHMNCIHAADDELEAWEYIKQVVPQYVGSIQKAVEKRRNLYRTHYPVHHLYTTNNTRSKVELINYKEKKAVKKTFKLGLERFSEREAYGYKFFSEKSSMVPPVLHQGNNYIIIPWYENILDSCSKAEKRKLLKPYGQSIIDILRIVYENGYALIGLYPGNLILTPCKELKVIDFEFLYKYTEKPKDFLLSYDIAGIPKDFDGDLPKGQISRGRTYQNTWEPLFGPISKYYF